MWKNLAQLSRAPWTLLNLASKYVEEFGQLRGPFNIGW